MPAAINLVPNFKWSVFLEVSLMMVVNKVEANPINNPNRIRKGTSVNDSEGKDSTRSMGSPPKKLRETPVAATAAIIIGMKLANVYSTIIISMTNITPARGVLNAADIAAAAPQASKILIALLGSPNDWPVILPTNAPR